MFFWDNKRLGSMRYISKWEMEVIIRGWILVLESVVGGVIVCLLFSLVLIWNNLVVIIFGIWL